MSHFLLVNCEDPDQTAQTGAVSSVSSLNAQT